MQTGDHVYEVRLDAVPSPAWLAAFQRPPASLTSLRYSPDIGGVSLHEARIIFRARPTRLSGWLRRIDTWIEYANSVIEE